MVLITHLYLLYLGNKKISDTSQGNCRKIKYLADEKMLKNHENDYIIRT